MNITGPTQLLDVNPDTSSTVQQLPLGTKAQDKFGREYRYVKAGASALVVGNLLQSAARDTQFTDMAVVSGAAGQKQIVVTLGSTATTANMFDGGVLAITVTPGIGQNFTIKSHTVAAGAAACTFTVYEDITTALTTSSKVTVSRNKYNQVIQSPTTRTGLTVGVATFAIPAGSFGWIGVRGEFAVLSDATVAAVGEGLSPSTTTAGAVTKQVTLLENIGTAAILGVSAKCEPAMIQIG